MANVAVVYTCNHRRSFKCTREVCYALKELKLLSIYNTWSNSYASFILSNLNFPRASIKLDGNNLDVYHFLDRSDKTSECKEKDIALQINNWKKRGGTPSSVFNVACG